MEARRDPIAPVDPADHADHLPTAVPPRLGVADLAEAAGVSTRTVRYYIAEGLLPPPRGAGPRSAYGSGHLDRLRLIDRLKDAYLPLREIRRRLDGLDDPAVRTLLDRLGPPVETAAGRTPPTTAPAAPPDDAAGYLARVMGRRPAASPAGPRRIAAPSVELRSPPPEQAKDGGALIAAGSDVEAEPAPLALDPALAALPPASEPVAAGESWRRVRLGPD